MKKLAIAVLIAAVAVMPVIALVDVLSSLSGKYVEDVVFAEDELIVRRGQITLELGLGDSSSYWLDEGVPVALGDDLFVFPDSGTGDKYLILRVLSNGNVEYGYAEMRLAVKEY